MPPFWTIGCIYGASAVTLGAFGAHGLKKRIADPAKLANWGTAAQYQVRFLSCLCPNSFPLVLSPSPIIFPIANTHPPKLIHSGILLVATTAAPKNTLAASLFVAGMTMFSGSIYLLTLDPQRFKALGPVTPLGGLCLIGGWAALAFGKRLPIPRV